MKTVAAYCRVSTDKEDQQNSFESQKRYFQEYIDRNPEWDLFEIYADEGFSGTSTKKRASFNKMINDAMIGKFDLIVTKEVSRFSRNVLDTIKYTRDLKAKGIGVLFLNDGINTLDSDSELRLSIMGSIAQEESRKTSERVKWGQMRCMERGVVFGRSMLGYDLSGGKMYINPDGAEIVKIIFHKFVEERKGTHVIAREMREEGFKSYRGDTNWSNTAILRLLRNEKYCGDLVQKKTYTLDYLTHTKKYNRGQEDFITIRDHHEPIISRELFEQAQRELQRRAPSDEVKAMHGNRYPLSGKIKCGECDRSFVSRFKKRTDGSRYKAWRCLEAARNGLPHVDKIGNEVGCNINHQIRDENFMLILQRTVESLQLDKNEIISNVTSIVRSVVEQREDNGKDDLEKLQSKLILLGERKQGLIDVYLAKDINKAEFRDMSTRYDAEMKELKQQIASIKKREGPCYSCDSLMKDVTDTVKKLVFGNMQDDNFYSSLLQKMVVYRGYEIEVFLNLLPYKWTYVIENLKESRTNIGKNEGETASEQYDTPVPISVNIPLISAYGMV
jgi:site-specific DNA recombinase